MSDNMRIFNAFKDTPAEAIKPITDGKLKGKSDINPMWRIKKLTEQFGPIGIGWNYKVTRTEFLAVPQKDEIMCFVDILLYYKNGNEWSEPIFGTGGSMLVENFRTAGIKSNDDGYKMALTDAISVACKELGMSADVHWAAGESKYTRPAPSPQEGPVLPQTGALPKSPTRVSRIAEFCNARGITEDEFTSLLKSLRESGIVSRKTTVEMTEAEFQEMLLQVLKGHEAGR